MIATGNHNIIVLGAQAAELLAALSQGKVVPAVPEPPADPTAYLDALRERTAYIEIRGLQVSSGNAPRFPIEELYIPLTTTLPELGDAKWELETAAAEMAGRRSARVELDEALRQRVLVIVGDPGSGKTTFLRRIAHLLCETLLGNRADAAERELGLAGRPFPLFIRLADLAQHIAAARKHGDGPRSADAPGWIAHYLASQENEEGGRPLERAASAGTTGGPLRVDPDVAGPPAAAASGTCSAGAVHRVAPGTGIGDAGPRGGQASPGRSLRGGPRDCRGMGGAD